MRSVPVDDLQRPTGQGELRVIQGAEQCSQALPHPSLRRRYVCRKLGGEAMLPAENPKILYSLGHHTQSVGVNAMGKRDRGWSCHQQLGASENEPERAL